MSRTAVVHLVRACNGLAPFVRFLDAYRRGRGGMDHDLVVIFKGFSDETGLKSHRQALAGLAYDELRMPDAGFDIGPYREAVQKCTHDHLCFLNSFSVPLDPDWLAKLHHHARREGVGVAGATGSWESHSSDWYRLARRSDRSLLRRGWAAYQGLRLARVFPPFPNPHIRTNAFIASRSLLAGLQWPRAKTKTETFRFESGHHSMTRQILDRHLLVVVVGRDGIGYPPPQWMESATFRAGDQRNLLVSDNQTEAYAQADPAQQAWFNSLVWHPGQS